MTSLTGSTAMELRATVQPVPFAVATCGACLQMASLVFVWHRHTSASACLSAPLECGDAWGLLAVLVLCGVVVIWAVSLFTARWKGRPYSDSSIVDRLWSLQPIAYVWYCYCSAPTARGLCMAALVTCWGLRLTFNFAVKGGFSGGEDYRWVEVRSWYAGWRLELFHAVFVCGFQQLEILAFTLPAVAAMQSVEPLCGLDAVACVAFVALTAGEACADAQMLRFQAEKYRRLTGGHRLEGTAYAKGFFDRGLYAFSRHPNYFCEVALWWAFYLFSVAATQRVVNWTVLGALYLTLMFVPPGASVDVTEHLSSRKYADYADYQRRVARFVPGFPRVAAGESSLISERSRRFYRGFFCLHVPITLCVDAQAALDARLFPAPLKKLLAWYVRVCGDQLMGAPPAWFRAIVWAELVLQLPFFFVAAAALHRRQDAQIRPFMLLYGAHTATTLLPILAAIFAEDDTQRTLPQRLLLAAIYFPFLAVPLAIVCSFFDAQQTRRDPDTPRKAD